MAEVSFIFVFMGAQRPSEHLPGLPVRRCPPENRTGGPGQVQRLVRRFSAQTMAIQRLQICAMPPSTNSSMPVT